MTLGLSDADFWALSFAQYFALHDRYNDGQAENDYRFGIIATLIKSAAGSRGATIADYFPRLKSKAKPKTTSSSFFNTLKARQAIFEGNKK